MGIPKEAEPQDQDFALHGIPDPEPHAANVNIVSGDPELKCLQR